MRYRTHRDVRLSEVGIGTYGLSGAYGPADPQEYERTLRRAYEVGINFFDTAEAYGDAEEILGRAVRPFRRDIHIATKVGVRVGSTPTLSKRYVKEACSTSLARLATDYVDLYQVHFDDPATPVDETIAALEELVKEGKIRRYGLCHLPLQKVEAYCDRGDVFSVLMELSAVARAARTTLLPLCRARGVAAIAFSPTGRGLLTGRFTEEQKHLRRGDIREIDPLFQREQYRSGLRVMRKLASLSERHGRTPAQTAIAWVLAQPGVVCALTGPSTRAHLEENVRASGWSIPLADLEDLETFLGQEELTLGRERRESLCRILYGPHPPDPAHPLADLLYVAENAVDLGLAPEDEVVPLVRQLLALRKKVRGASSAEIDSLRAKLRRTLNSRELQSG